MKYTELTFTELVNKIGSSRFFDLPKMLKEVLSRLAPQEPKYKVYTALLTQSGTDAPVATVLENTLGNVVWSYNGVGDYSANLNGVFLENKTYPVSEVPDNGYTSQFIRTDEDTVSLTITPSDDNISQSFPIKVEIRVYN
jgi:hypothetical protein